MDSFDYDVFACSGDTFYKALEHVAGAYLKEMVRSVGEHGLDALGPADRGSKLEQKVGLDVCRIGFRGCADILVNGSDRGAEVRGLDCCAKLCACGLHERGVECSADGEGERTLGACCLEGRARLAYGFSFA